MEGVKDGVTCQTAQDNSSAFVHRVEERAWITVAEPVSRFQHRSGGNRGQQENRLGLVPVQEELIILAEKFQDICRKLHDYGLSLLRRFIDGRQRSSP